jgi:hypothetical protein
MNPVTRIALALLQLWVSVALAPLASVMSLLSLVLVLPLLLWLWLLAGRLILEKSAQSAARLSIRLQRTHGALLVLEGLLIVYGLFALESARASAAAGGGLLGAFGLIPIGMGLLAGIGSLATIVLCRYVDREPSSPRDSMPHR